MNCLTLGYFCKWIGDYWVIASYFYEWVGDYCMVFILSCRLSSSLST